MQVYKTALLLSLGYGVTAQRGGWESIEDLNDRDALEAAQYAVDNIPNGLYKFQQTMLDSNCDYLTAEIIDGGSQVVAGMKYDLDIEVVDCDHYCAGIFEAEIYVDPSWNIQVTKWGSETPCDEVHSFGGDGEDNEIDDYYYTNEVADSFNDDGGEYNENNDSGDSFYGDADDNESGDGEDRRLDDDYF